MALRLAVLISGRGSNLAALLEQVHNPAEIAASIVGVISSREDAGGLELAQAARLPCTIINSAGRDRSSVDADLAAALDELQPDWVLLAGFMRILGDELVAQYGARMLNIHPSLLPAYPGLRTHERALADGVREHGASVHRVVAQVDAGAVIAQARVPVHPDDDTDRLAARVLDAEHQLYPQVVHWLAAGRLDLQAEPARLDGAALPAGGVQLTLGPHGRLEIAA